MSIPIPVIIKNPGMFLFLTILAVVTKDTNYTTTANDYAVLCNASSGAITIGLPTASGIAGREYAIKKIDSSPNAVTVDPYGTETIDGDLNYVLGSQYRYIKIMSDGANWQILGNN